MLELNSGIVWTVINLIILVVLMRIFLFKPIQKVIDERKKMISEQIDSAKDREESAAKKLEEAEAYLQASGDNARKQAEAILKVQQAKADGIRFIKEAGADQSVLTLKSLEAFAEAADGKATKIIIPSEIQGIAGLAASLKEVVTEEK